MTLNCIISCSKVGPATNVENVAFTMVLYQCEYSDLVLTLWMRTIRYGGSLDYSDLIKKKKNYIDAFSGYRL